MAACMFFGLYLVIACERASTEKELREDISKLESRLYCMTADRDYWKNKADEKDKKIASLRAEIIEQEQEIDFREKLLLSTLESEEKMWDGLINAMHGQKRDDLENQRAQLAETRDQLEETNKHLREIGDIGSQNVWMNQIGSMTFGRIGGQNIWFIGNENVWLCWFSPIINGQAGSNFVQL